MVPAIPLKSTFNLVPACMQCESEELRYANDYGRLAGGGLLGHPTAAPPHTAASRHPVTFRKLARQKSMRHSSTFHTMSVACK